MKPSTLPNRLIDVYPAVGGIGLGYIILLFLKSYPSEYSPLIANLGIFIIGGSIMWCGLVFIGILKRPTKPSMTSGEKS